MKNNQTIRFAALGLGLLIPTTLAFMPSGTSIRFAPEQGLTLTKTFIQTAHVQLESIEQVMGDETREVDEVPEVTIESVETIIFKDTYDSVGEGRPIKLTRHFTELGLTRDQTARGEELHTEETSALTDLVVIYNWDDDEGEFSASFDEDSEGDEDLLEPTWCEADFLGFLPDGEVDEGDTWEVDMDAWRHALQPGGDMTYVDDEGEPTSDEIDKEISESLEGEVTCEFKGFREEDGLRVAVIAVTVEIEGSGDSETVLEIEPNEQINGVTQTRAVSISNESEGELLWNVEAGHMVSFNLVGETSVEVREVALLDLVEGGNYDQGQTLIFSTESEIEFTFE